MKLRSNLFILISALILTACVFEIRIKDKTENKPEPVDKINMHNLAKIWRLSEITSATETTSDNLLAEAVNNQLLEIGICLCLFPDGKASEYKGESYISYHWQLNPENKTIIILSDTQSDTLRIIEYKNTGHIQSLTLEFKDYLRCTFSQSDSMLNKFENDPYYPSNNLWRIKPEKAENNKELNQRLLNYVQHILYVLKAAIEREASVVNFENSKGILKIYNGGIGIQEEDRIPESWKSGFYNEEQAMIVYEMYRTYLQKTRFKGARTGNWVKDDYNILLALYKTIHDDIDN